MDESPGSIKFVLVEIDQDIDDEELHTLTFLCTNTEEVCYSQANWSLDDVDYCMVMNNAEKSHLLSAVSVLSKTDLPNIKTAYQLFDKIREVTRTSFNSVGFIKSIILLLRSIRREDLVHKLLPFFTWSVQNSRQGTPNQSRRPSMYQPIQADLVSGKFVHTDGVDPVEAKRALIELLEKDVVLPNHNPGLNNDEFIGGDFPLPALIFFIFIFMMPAFNSMVHIYDGYIHPPVTVQRDHTDVPVVSDKELLGRPVLYGLTRPDFHRNQDLSLHSQNVRNCLAKHKRCLIKGYFGEGKSHTLSLYIHESIGKYPAGIICLREWKDLAAVAEVIASHRGKDVVIRKQAAPAYLQDFLWNSSGWLLTIQDEHLWNSDDFKRVLNLFLNLESQDNHVIITSHRIPEPLHDSIKVYEFNAGVLAGSDSPCNGMIEDVLLNSISLTEEEKSRLLPIWETTSCNPYAINRITNFINEWNFTVEGFVSTWNEMTKKEWLDILGFGPNSQALSAEMTILTDLKERHPGVINFILDYIKTGKVRHDIPNCKLHAHYKGEPLLSILGELRDLSLANVVVNTEERLCSVQMPALLRLLIEVTFLMREDRLERSIEGD